jgi:DNA-binding transcriptional ArsR family regulator
MKRKLTDGPQSALFERFQDHETCKTLVGMLSLLSNPIRFRALCLLSSGEFCVNDIVRLVGGKGSNISQQLRMLTLAGYIAKRRDGKQIFYELVDEKIRSLVEFLHGLVDR